MINKFYEHEKYACIYYAYNTIQKYLVSCLYKFLGVGVQCICILHYFCLFEYSVFAFFMILV
jgi:hypothetical protein